MINLFRSILHALPGAATSPWAFGAYGLTLLAWAIIAWRVQRNLNLLKRIESFPPADRLRALQSEMEVPADIPPEIWLRSKARRYILVAFMVAVAAAVVVVIVAIQHRGDSNQVRVSDITATLTVGTEEAGNPCPPELGATTLRLLGSISNVANQSRKSWYTDVLDPTAELRLSSLGSQPITEWGGEKAHETCFQTIKFTGFSGNLGILKRLDRWQGAWIEAVVEGSGSDSEWNEFFDQQYLPEDRTQLQEEFRKFYGLSKDSEFGRSTGLQETITIFLNGRQILSAQGIVTRSGDGFHGTPDSYTVKCKPTLVKFEPVHRS